MLRSTGTFGSDFTRENEETHMKTAAVIISGAPAGDNLRDIDVPPGSSAGDVLRTLDLNGYLLSKEGSAQAFAAEEDIYAAIQSGDKLRATPVAEVGAGFWRRFLSAIGYPLKPTVTVRERKATASPARKIATPVPRPAGNGRLQVDRDRRSLWEIRGWTRNGNRLTGAFRTPKGSFVGEVALKRRGAPEFYIINPPEGLLRGSHGPCFRSRGGGKYWVHFGLANPDVDAGIVAIEKLIVRALSGRQR
ncbi:MAG: hypothetical protein DWQ34_00910 [Planctomycetota bacterium]|nr:MAG: hypothetical protein DWQ29_23850 [Planctomycetota bacterium]REJ97840.1 MAG: hypothetical protein DWQ34_00910 [Planctomycetota bacterium]REK34720.1 MAG: hypothetical protein DWQ45_12935 [Planctomycetota bacterium]